MAKIPEVVPVTDLRQDAASVLRRVQGRKQPLIITQRGRAAAVMLSLDAYERGEHEREILLLLARGHDLDAVLAEADAVLRAGEL